MSEVPESVQPAAQFNPTLSRRTAEEDRAWAQLYASVGQTSTAEEVVKQLDADTEARRSHLALYVRAKTTLRERRVTDARNQRTAAVLRTLVRAFVKLVVTVVVVGPVHLLRLLRNLLSTGSGIAVAILAPACNGAAKIRAGARNREPEFARAADKLTPMASAVTPITGQHEELRSAKAA